MESNKAPASLPVSLNLTLPADPAISAQRFLALATDYVVDSPETLQAAAEDITTISHRRKAIDETRHGFLRPIRELQDRVNALFNPALQILEQAERALKGKVGTYQIEERRKADAARRAAEEAARHERERLAREAAEREEASRAEAQRQREEAAAAAQRGNIEAAAVLEQQAAVTESAGQAEAQAIATVAACMPTMLPQAAPKVAGMSMRDNWSAEVHDKLALIRAVAEGKASIELLDVNMTSLNGMARSLKASLSVPGVRAVNNPVVAAGRRRAA